MNFSIVQDSYGRKSEDQIGCTLNCPIPGCNESFNVSLKIYRNYYRFTKREQTERAGQSKWTMSTFQNHILATHSDDETDITDAVLATEHTWSITNSNLSEPYSAEVLNSPPERIRGSCVQIQANTSPQMRGPSVPSETNVECYRMRKRKQHAVAVDKNVVKILRSVSKVINK